MADPFLFSYGTLSEPEYIQRLLQRVPVYEAAVLAGYGLYKHPGNGYLFVKPEEGGKVSGQLFQLKWRELELVDYWEDVPLYERETLTVQTGSGKSVEAFVYTQKATSGIPAAFADAKNRRDILNDLEDFLDEMRRGGFFK
jgi:gamma-glutamylcyclotransferase (GGCT)/AIG2-like uncharacterized protein YtfP